MPQRQPGFGIAPKGLAALALSLALLAAGCAMFGKGEGPQEVYRAELRPLNADATGYSPTGTALVEVYEDMLVVTVSLQGVPPNMEHMQHVHGFVEDEDAICPDEDADVNNDGVVDLIEAEKSLGRTLIPLDDEPADLAIQGDYPRAVQDGTLTYSQRIPLDTLKSNVKQKYGLDELDLDDMAITIHGVPQSMRLSPTVKTLPGVPVQAALPIACGVLEEVED